MAMLSLFMVRFKVKILHLVPCQRPWGRTQGMTLRPTPYGHGQLPSVGLLVAEFDETMHPHFAAANCRLLLVLLLLPLGSVPLHLLLAALPKLILLHPPAAKIARCANGFSHPLAAFGRVVDGRGLLPPVSRGVGTPFAPLGSK